MDRGIERKLTTILAADVAGYSRLMAADEEAALRMLRERLAVFRRLIARHAGRVVNTAGDGLLADFPSVVEAVNCAIEVQRELAALNDGADEARAMRFRVGVHLGDVMVDGGDLFGEGVNLAARLQALAEPGGILVSEPVYQQVRSKLPVRFDYLGTRPAKNLPEELPVYALAFGESATGRARGVGGRRAAAAVRGAVAAACGPAGGWFGLRQRAKRFGVLALALFGIDLVTGSGLWFHWPALALGLMLALQAAPLMARGWFSLQVLRLLLAAPFLVTINLLTWDGYPWALWPLGAAVVGLLLLRAGSGGRPAPG